MSRAGEAAREVVEPVEVLGDAVEELRIVHLHLLARPSGGFRLNLHLYGPAAAALEGDWTPPGVQNLGPAGLT